MPHDTYPLFDYFSFHRPNYWSDYRLSIYLCIYLHIYLSTELRFSMTTHLTIYLPNYLDNSLTTYLTTFLTSYLYNRQLIEPPSLFFTYLIIELSTRISIYLSI